MSTGVRGAAVRQQTPGPILFVRYALGPNRHGYCGPDDNTSFFEYGVTGKVDNGLRSLAMEFAGAWPYLELIAGATGIADPLDHRVVEAYWVGNALLDKVGAGALGNSMEDRFRYKTGHQFADLAEGVVAGGMPHHSFHVFCIYPWVGLLGDDRRSGQALTVLDKCRIRWGKVIIDTGDQVVVESRPLTWDGRRLELGEPQQETVIRGADGRSLLAPLQPGEWVAMHWEWVCDRLTPEQLTSLRRYTVFHLSMVNDRLSHPGAKIALG
jgi:hypothetical protein